MERQTWITAAIATLAATSMGLACTAADDSNGDLTQTTQAAQGDNGKGTDKEKKNPPGNNGTVKIQEVGADDEIPDNDPHVGCKFLIEFRGYDKGDLNATWTLSAQAPSGKDEIASGSLKIGEDEAGGANDLDGTVEVNLADYDLSGLFQHPQQGYHIKLLVNAEGSHGADKKHKVFWTQGCPTPPPGGGSSSGGSSSGGSTW
jgi:hypothetical protein